MLKKLALLLSMACLASCRIYVVTLQGGEVHTSSSGSCPELSVCTHHVADTTYTETFTAVPYTNLEFVKWRGGDKYLCANSTNPVCVVSTALLAGFENGQSLIDSGGDYLLSPIFQSTPVTDTILFGDKEWAQVNLFRNTSFAEIDAVCPAATGLCLSDGHLNGYNMSGWIWASEKDINELFNTFIGSNQLGPGASTYTEANSSWAPKFFDEGFQPTTDISSSREIAGRIRLTAGAQLGSEAGVLSDQADKLDADLATTKSFLDGSSGVGYAGAWFYRPR